MVLQMDFRAVWGDSARVGAEGNAQFGSLKSEMRHERARPARPSATRLLGGLRHAAQHDNGQVFLPALERDCKFEPDAGLAFDEHLRLGTG